MVTTGIHRKKRQKARFGLKNTSDNSSCIRYTLLENEKNFVQILKQSEGFRLEHPI
jgi:hypothetical protein